VSEKFDHGPLRTYEIVWQSGHVETVQGHQVHFTGTADAVFNQGVKRAPRFTIHGEIDGHWRLVLSGLEDDVATIRDVTAPEQVRDPEVGS
jgi:hypothetical protein